jgi:hypothetical protein
MSMKNPNDTIEPTTFQLVPPCLNQVRHRVPSLEHGREKSLNLTEI